ncbi:GTP-binding protein [Actinomyces gaoshouyii]|nr:GTP-binding protein [Actinomyces gaoshouyii]
MTFDSSPPGANPPPSRSPHADAGHRIALIGAVDPALLDLAALSLHGEDALVIATTIHPDRGEHGVISLSSVGSEALDGEPSPALAEPAVLDIDMPMPCPTCALREVLLAVAQDRAADDPRGATVILLPPAIEIVHLAPRLAEALEAVPGVALAGVAHAVLTVTAVDEILTHIPLADRGLAWGEGDPRCTGEVHMLGLGYADVIIAVGEEGAGADLVEHLRAHDALLLPGFDAPVLNALMSVRHDARAAVARVHPASTRAWGGPVEHGVRTLDLVSDRPFHPERLRELVADLAGAGMCARGCFWLPSRPGRVCAWEVAGGAVTVGDAGTWDEAPVAWGGEETLGAAVGGPVGPRCHLVITGIADDATCERVREAFSRILLRPDEFVMALAWSGPDGDAMDDWFGGD